MVWTLRAVDPALGKHSFAIRSPVTKSKCLHSYASPNSGLCAIFEVHVNDAKCVYELDVSA